MKLFFLKKAKDAALNHHKKFPWFFSLLFIPCTLAAHIQIYAHRGGRAYSPENSLPAYRSALAVGTHWVDMDVVLSKDGEVVVSHDLVLRPELVRDKNGIFLTPESKKLVKDLTLNELRQFDIGRINPESAYAKFFPEQFPVDGTPMPTLREVIRFVNRRAKNSVGFQIEMKTDPAQPHLSPDPEIFARALLRVLKEEKVLARSEIQAFDFRCLAALQKMDRKTKTAYLTSRENTPDGKISFPQLIKNLGGYAWEPEDSELTQNDLAEAKRLGLKVVVWSWTEKQGIAFDPTMVAKMIAWGVDGIITDDPGRLASMLAARGLPVPPRFTIF